ncbi:PREDICTED: protein NLRC3-like [Amphimedon queenslandica]|nr:PREDICTED: protein NLRC3-like [Amphimedon queenslandica]|eukprot:XP_019860369.1 PREDICTED: protein NLRC3-like [Amphimedon queenslandica]
MVLIASPSEIIQFLIPTILERKAIKQLTIYSSLSPEDILSFSSELSTNKSLTSLQIIHNSISDDGVFVLAQALQYNETLQYLYLNDNPDITSASAQSLAKLYKLSCLNLDNTNIDPNEVMDLMESLMQDQ